MQEAGSFVVCHTKTWKSGVSDKAWWVYPDQVSKTTPSGEFITTGSFIIRGTKNYIKNTKLELGLGILFKTNKNKDLNPITDGTDILYGIPMCGPYTSLRDYKYKVKIVPGRQKTGKTVKKIISNFTKGKSSLEKICIKKIPLDCFNRVMVNHVTIV